MSNSNNFLESETEQHPAKKAKLHCDTLSTHQLVNYIIIFVIEVCSDLCIKPVYIWFVLSAGKCNNL
jgi:hypothetical protein